MKKPAIFLDRDGVLNKAIIRKGKPYPPSCLSDLEIPIETQDALDQLKTLNFLLIGITNQPDVARGMVTKDVVQQINSILIQHLSLETIFVCYHDDEDNCLCRKPLPGLILEAAKQYNIDVSKSIMIGDRWKDIESGQNAGCKTIWIDYSYLEKKPDPPPDFTAFSLREAVQWIIQTRLSQ